MRNPTKEQIIEQVNLYHEYMETTDRGEPFPLQYAEWGSDDWKDCLGMGLQFLFKFRKTPPKRIARRWYAVVRIDGESIGHGGSPFKCSVLAGHTARAQSGGDIYELVPIDLMAKIRKFFNLDENAGHFRWSASEPGIALLELYSDIGTNLLLNEERTND